MPKSVFNTAIFLILLGGLFFASCQKDDNTYYSYNKGLDATKDYVIGQQMMVLILNTYFKSISDSLLLATGKNGNIDGADVSLLAGEPDTLLLHYPWYGRDDGYGHWRTGDIKVCVNQGFYNTAADYNFHFVDFLYDKDTLRVDSLVLKYLGKESANDVFSVYSDTIHQVFSDTSGIQKFWMNQSFIRLKDAASEYFTPLDKFEISGNFDGEARNGMQYFTLTPNDPPLLNQFDCSFLKQGPVSIQFADTTYQGNIYFSEADTCANQYIVEFDGSPFPSPIYSRDW